MTEFVKTLIIGFCFAVLIGCNSKTESYTHKVILQDGPREVRVEQSSEIEGKKFVVTNIEEIGHGWYALFVKPTQEDYRISKLMAISTKKVAVGSEVELLHVRMRLSREESTYLVKQ